LLDRLEDRRPREAPQQQHQEPKDHDRPEDHPGIDVERGGLPGPFLDGFAVLQQQRQQRHLSSLKSRANTRAASVAPSMSAAVRIMAPRISAEASGWRAMASTAWPPMRPMPRPAPMMASPIPIPAPSSALLFSAATAVGSWSSRSMLCMGVL